MSITSYISSARELLSGLLQEAEDKTKVDQSPYSPESIRYRKWYWNCNKASRTLAELAESDLPTTTEADMDKIIQTQETRTMYSSSMPQTYNRPPPPPAVSVPRREYPVGSTKQSYGNVTQSAAPVVEKLNMDGFEAIQKFLDKYKLHEGGRKSNRPYISLGDLGMMEGWTTILTNAAYCYDNTPAEGWRKEVAIRMSGKSRGSTDIHYVTPDKARRFRSRQELQAYLTRSSTSVDFINKFDFRAAFCVCHQNEDNSRSYLECSYGLAGCNRWVHPECVCLGVRSEQELALMPKVICPLCTAYLESTGQMDSIRTPDMLILRDICWEPAAEPEDEITATDLPHVMWGLQGSPFVYCSPSHMSGLDAAQAAAAAAAAVKTSSPDRAISRQQSHASSLSLSTQSGNQPPPAATSTAAGEGPELNTILQHRLFQSWGAKGNSGEGSSSSQREGGGYGAHHQPQPVVEPEEVVLSDDDYGVPSNPLNLEPVDRVRRARTEDGATVMIRVDGGWMARKKPRMDGASTAGIESAPTPTLEGAMDVEETPVDLEVMKQRILEMAAAREATGGPTSRGLPARYKNELIEAAVNAAQSSSHKRKTSFTPGTITAVATGHAPAAMIEQTMRELRDSYQVKPSLCYLPMEDGGVRFASVSFAQVPRSLHPMCVTNVLCGVCLQYSGADSGDTEAVALPTSKPTAVTAVPNQPPKRGRPKKQQPASEVQTPQTDRFQLTRVKCGNVHYSAHKQCAGAVAGDFLSAAEGARSPKAVTHGLGSCHGNGHESGNGATEVDGQGDAVITLAAAYEYDQIDDAECDLCGRKGGVLRYFNLSRDCCSTPAPAAEGWLAHIPCIQFLQASRLLTPLAEGDATAMGEADTLPRFAMNPLACDVAATTGAGAGVRGTVSITPGVNTKSAEQEGAGDPDDEAGNGGAVGEVNLRANLLQVLPPRSRFDQQLGHWRCTLCGLQCGVAPRCLVAGCTVRAHPLCVTAVNHSMWRVCTIRREESASVGILCPLHSGGLEV